MSKIFSEIKKAIEEEMRNAEGRPPPGGQREGGRRAQEYSEWLKQEQDRLRGGGQPETVERPPADGRRTEQQWEQQTEQQWEERQVRRPDPERSLEQPQRSERASTPRRTERSTQYQRSEARHQRATDDAYRYGPARGSYLKSQVHSLLRSPHGLRQAFVLREIVSKPVSLRDKDDHLIS